MPKKIFDCFTFFNELDLLDVRLRELYDKVDYFVLAESTLTFQNKPKPLTFQDNKARYKDFADKIIHVVVDDMPTEGDAWRREHFQRRMLSRGLDRAAPDDIVIIADADEILRADTIDFLREHDGYFQFVTPMYQFFVNTRASSTWNKVFAFSHRLKDELPDFSYIRVKQTETFEKFAGQNHHLPDAGWHFTYLGGAEKVREKLGSYSHTGGVYDEMRRDGAIELQLISGHVVGGGEQTVFVELDESFPRLIQEDRERFLQLGWIKDTMIRMRELEKLYRDTSLKLRFATRRAEELAARFTAEPG